MMQRQPEPELMDEAEQALAYARADFEEPHENFVNLIEETFPAHDFNGWTLDLGCGPADITLRFARRFPRAQIDAVDGAEAMLALGREAVAQSAYAERIHLWRKYLPDDAMPRTHYDAIISNSLLHHLRQPLGLWQCIRNYTGNGARVFVMDLMRPESIDAAQQMVAQYAADEAEILQRDFYYSLLAAYTVEEVQQQLQQVGLTGLQVRCVSDRHLTVSGIIE
jgi:trans-aconitate methyltransferase